MVYGGWLDGYLMIKSWLIDGLLMGYISDGELMNAMCSDFPALRSASTWITGCFSCHDLVFSVLIYAFRSGPAFDSVWNLDNPQLRMITRGVPYAHRF